MEEKLEEKGRLGEEITLEEVTSLMLLRNSDYIIINETRIEEVISITEIKEVMSGGFITTAHANSLDGVELKKKFPKMWTRAKLESR